MGLGGRIGFGNVVTKDKTNPKTKRRKKRKGPKGPKRKEGRETEDPNRSTAGLSCGLRLVGTTGLVFGLRIGDW